MKRRTLAWNWCVCLSFVLPLLAGCSFDLEVPAQPLRGGLKGIVDTQPATTQVPAGDLAVRLIRVQTGARYDTRTDLSGAFELNELPPGAYQVNADPPTFAPLREGPFLVVTGMVTDVGTLAPQALATTSRGRLRGQVVVNGGAAAGADAGGRPSDASGASVAFLLETAGNARLAEATVNVLGNFEVELPPGRYTLQVSHPYYVSASRPGIDLAAGAMADLTMDPLVLELNPAELSGTVTVEVDKKADATVAGVLVSSDTGFTAVTDAAGRFVLGGLAAGRRTFTFTRAGFHDPDGTHSFDFGGGEKKAAPPLRLLLDRGDVTGEVEMADGTPLQQVTVDVVGLPYAGAASQSTTAAAKGRFVLAGVPVGTYNVRASRPSYVAAQTAVVTLAKGAALDVGTLRLTRVQGDFVIDDGDATNTPGFTRTTDVTLRLMNVANAAQYRVAESSAALLAASWVPFTTNDIPFVLSGGDGAKTVFLQFRDAQNNESAPLSAEVVLDQTPPSMPAIAIAGGAGFTRLANPLPVTLTAVDDGSGLAFVRLSASPAVDGSGVLMAARVGYQRDLSFTRPTSTDGAQAVSAQFIDNAGNHSVVVTGSIVIDTVAPTGVVTVRRGPRATLDGFTDTVLVDLSVTPGGAEPNGGFLVMRLANDAMGLAVATTQQVRATVAWFLDPNGQGSKQVHYQLVDAAGNASAPGMASVIYDLTPPAVTATLTSPALTRSAGVTLSINGTDGNPLSPTEGLTLSESAVFSGATPTAFPSGGNAMFTLSAADGQKVVYVRVKDAAGNSGTASVAVTLDRTAPTGLSVTLVGALADGTPSGTLSASTAVDVVLTHTGAAGVLLGDAAALTSCPASGYTPLSANTLTDYPLPGSGGTRTLAACFIDAAGNTAGPVTDEIDVDATTPTGCVLGLTGRRTDGTATSGGAAAKTALRDVGVALSSCSEAPVEIALTEGTITCSAAAPLLWVPFDALAAAYGVSPVDGMKTVRGCVRDRARNTGGLVPATLTLDTTPPSATSVTVDNGAAYVNAAQKALRGGVNQVTVTGAATGGVEWALAEGATPSAFTAFPATSPASFTFSAGDGPKVVRALFRDDVGNVTPLEATDGVEFDTAAPTASITLTGARADGSPSPAVTATTSVAVNVTQAGATEYVLGDENLAACPSSGYTALPGATVPFTLTGAQQPRVVRACFRDAAGNPVGPVQATIALDVTTPTGCQVALSGFRRDGMPAPAGRTALLGVTASVSGCSEAPVEMVLTQGTLTCTSSASYPFTPFAASSTFNLAGNDGMLGVRGCVRDAAGNVGAIGQGFITLDTTPPTLSPTLSLDNGAPYVNLATFQSRGNVFSANATGTAFGATDWALSETNPPTGFVPFTSPATQAFTFAGGGARTLFAVFRDDVGNPTPVAFDSIEFDVTPPAALSLSLITPGGDPLYTNNTSVVVRLSGLSDATHTQLAQAAGAVCAASDFTAAQVEPRVSLSTFLLSSGDGVKRVCGRFLDAAGNLSTISSIAVTLDTTPPTTPQIITPDQFINAAHGAPFDVTIASDSLDTNFLGYQQLGGNLTGWTVVAPQPEMPVVPTATFRFTLANPAPSAEAGYRNELKLRAIDSAGNTSGEAAVFITADDNAPNPVTTNTLWVDNSDHKATVFWQASAVSPDVVGYRIFYGSAPDNLAGAFAVEGVSPVLIGPQTNFTLSGLPNGAPTYVRIAPVDRAGNLGPVAPVVPNLITLQPNQVSPNHVATVTMPNISSIDRMEPFGNWLYVAGTGSGCFAQANATALLYVVDLRQLESPVQQGQVQVSPDGPVVVGPAITLATNVSCHNGAGGGDILVDGAYLYTAYGNEVRIYSLAQPATPSLVSTVDMSGISPTWRGNSLSIVGSRLIVGGKQWDYSVSPTAYTSVISLDELFDGSAATTVTAADLLGTAAYVYNSGVGGSMVTRNRFITLANASDQNAVTRLDDALDSTGVTVFDASDVQSNGGGAIVSRSRFTVSGNYAYLASSSRGFSVFDVTPAWGAGRISTTPVVDTSFTGSGALAVAGPWVFLPQLSQQSLTVLDVSTVTQPQQSGQFLLGVQPTHVVQWGNYTFVSTGGAVRFFETATPRALHTTQALADGAYDVHVRGGFLFSPGSLVFDLQGGPVPPQITTSNAQCITGSAMFGDVEVDAIGNGLRVRDLSRWTDRDPVTAPLAGDTYDVTGFAATTRLTGLYAYGNYLVAAEVRTTGVAATQGVWLEVFRATDLRDEQPATSLSAADSIGAYQVSALTPTATMMADVTVADGRAVVAIDSGVFNSAGAFLHFVDLRPLFDDTAATALDLDSLQGSVGSMPNTRRGVIRGRYAYVATSSGFYIFDVLNVMDEDPLTKLPAVPAPVISYPGVSFSDVTVWGSAALLAPGTGGNGVYSVDVSNPTAPVTAGIMPFNPGSSNCVPALDLPQGRIMRGHIAVAGSRIYVQDPGELFVVEVE